MRSLKISRKQFPFAMQGMIQNFVRSTLSLTFVIAAARVVFNIKARMARETSWQLELKGDLTKQRRVEAVDKLLSVMTLLVSLVFGLQAIGLDGGPHFDTFAVCLNAFLMTLPEATSTACHQKRYYLRTAAMKRSLQGEWPAVHGRAAA